MISTTEETVENARAVIIFAHGAGADMNSEYLNKMSLIFKQHKFNVLRFNFPYMDKRKVDGKRRPPDRMPALLSCYMSVVENVDTRLPIYIAGKSMGGRVAATLAGDASFVEKHNVKGVFCIGYPFHPVKKPEKLRLEPLQETTLPILVLQGERDALGSRDEITHYELPELCRISFFEDGDHDLKPRVKSGFTLVQHQVRVADEIKGFIDENA